MNKKLEPLKKHLEEIHLADFSHKQLLGEKHGFIGVESDKQEAVPLLRAAVDELGDLEAYLPASVSEMRINELIEQVQNWRALENDCRGLASAGANSRDFDRQAQNLKDRSARQLGSVKNSVEDFQLTALTGRHAKRLAEINISVIEEKVADALATNHEQLKNQDKAFGELQQQLKQALTNIQDAAARKSYTMSKSEFDALATKHFRWQIAWLVIMVFGFGLLGWTIYMIYHQKIEPLELGQAMLRVFQKAVLLAGSIALTRIALTKFNSERHLHVLYAHRNTALAQLPLIEAAVDNDQAAKADLRIAAAKMILSDPATSYSAHSDGSEININPVFSSLEKFVGKPQNPGP